MAIWEVRLALGVGEGGSTDLPVIGAHRRRSERRGGGEEDKKMSRTHGVHWQNNIKRVQI